MKGKRMPYYFWGEATSTAMYILNRCPTKRLQGYTPKKTWLEKKPSVSYFRIFGSLLSYPNFVRGPLLGGMELVFGHFDVLG